MKDRKLKPRAAALFSLLEAGERLTGRELALIRDDLTRLLHANREDMFSKAEPELRAWHDRQQAYTGHIVDVLTRNHFRPR